VKVILFILSFCLILCVNLPAEQLSAQEDEILYNRILELSGKASETGISTSESHDHIKCGTPELMDLISKLDDASQKTRQAWISLLEDRYTSEAPLTYESPGGHFLIHYAIDGDHAVRMDDDFGVNSGTNLPDYVDSVASIYDSVWKFEVDYLGYDAPPEDSFYAAGGDYRFDVFLVDLDQVGWSGAYGVTYPDSLFGIPKQYATSFQAIDNDYTEYSIYSDRPLDIIKVTAAHEFFHVIQFGYDATEFENNFSRRHWPEMSCVWMEDRMYDDINDYYYYLPTFYAYINYSLVTGTPGLYQYGAVVWPKFLHQKWGDEMIQRIWEICEETKGPNVFQNGFHDAIDELSGSTETFASALSEFYIWNYFTGDRKRPNFGFEESEYWDMVPDQIKLGRDTFDFMLRYNEYPVEFVDQEYRFLPSHYGGFYIRFSGFNQLDSTLNITFNGTDEKLGYDIHWNNRIVGFNPHLPGSDVYVDPQIYTDNHSVKITEDVLDNYSEVIMVLSPYAEIPANRRALDSLWFTLNVADTSEPITQIVISEPFPNPYIISSELNSGLFVKILMPEPETIKMQVHTLAGEKVYENQYETSATSTLINWDCLNDSGEKLASGMYLMYISAGDTDKVCKIAIIE